MLMFSRTSSCPVALSLSLSLTRTHTHTHKYSIWNQCLQCSMCDTSGISVFSALCVTEKNSINSQDWSFYGTHTHIHMTEPLLCSCL